MSNPPDRSQLWTTSLQDTSADALKAASAAQEAQSGLNGLPNVAENDRFVLQQRYENNLAYARTQESAAQFGAQQYQAQQFAVAQHNAPIEHALREQSEAQTRQMMADTARFATAAVATTAAVGMADDMSPGMATIAAGNIFAGGLAPTVMSMSARSMFNAGAATPAQRGQESVLDKVLGPVVAAVAIDNVAKASPAVAADVDAPSNVAARNFAAPPPVATNMALELHNNSLANGPKRPTWAAEKPMGGGGMNG